MGRPRKYKSNAERQAAYRERQKAKAKKASFKELLDRVQPAGPTAWEQAQRDLAEFRGPDPKKET